MKKLLSSAINRRAFSLIELMIIVAIIGLLASIAIPNYISFRNKAYCSHAEMDASNISRALGAYFAIPANTAIDTSRLLSSASLNNTHWDVKGDPNLCITITVKDDSGRCPLTYQQEMGGWDNGVFTRVMKF